MIELQEKINAELAALEAERRKHDERFAWTKDSEGRTNSSDKYNEVVELVARLIKSDGYSLLNSGAESTARLIVSRLTGDYGFRPTD